MCLLVEGWLFWFEDVWYRQSEGKGENNDWFYMMEREREREREREMWRWICKYLWKVSTGSGKVKW